MANFYAVLRACGMGIIGWMFPRMLLAASIPLDAWAKRAGEWLSGFGTVISGDTLITALGVIFALALMTLEIWIHPVKKLIDKFRSKKETQATVTKKPNPFSALAQEFKDCDATWKALTRPPEMFVMDWMRYLGKLRIERNTHDIPNLFNLIPINVQASPGNGHMNVSRDEILFTLRCLELRGYLVLKKISNHLIGGVGGHYNEEIKYTDKYDDFMKGITFKDTADGYSVYW